MTESTDAVKIADQALRIAKLVAPSADVQVNVHESSEGNIRFALGVVQSCGEESELGVNIRMAFGKRSASASSNQSDEESLRSLAERVASMAKSSPEDPEIMPLLGPQKYAQAPIAFDPAITTVTSASRTGVPAAANHIFSESGLVGAGFFEYAASEYSVANSSGLRASSRETSLGLQMTARTPDGAGSGSARGESHLVSGIDAVACAKVAAKKAKQSAHPKTLEPGHYTVVLEPPAVAELLGFLFNSLDARSIDEGRSALSRHGGASPLGELIASPIVTLRSNPADPDMPCAPFDGEGLPREPIVWIENGALKSLSYSRYWAAKQGKKPTSMGGWHLTGGVAESSDELVKGVKRGLLVTRFWYTRHLDPQKGLITGLTRDGVLLIENGEIVGPVNNFRFNESPFNMLKNCDAMTRKTTRVSSFFLTCVPAIRTNRFKMASISVAI